MIGGKMSNTDESVVAEEQIDSLQRENAILKESIERLRQTNAEQLSRLVDQTLLRSHANDLQAKLNEKEDK
jgi:phosphoserine phosphatase